MRAGIKLVVMACTAALMAFSAAALAQEYTRKQWWPSEWGPGDQLGALNRLTPAKVLEATALIRTGTIYDMTFVYEESMPLFDLTKKTVHAEFWGPLDPATMLMLTAYGLVYSALYFCFAWWCFRRRAL